MGFVSHFQIATATVAALLLSTPLAAQISVLWNDQPGTSGVSMSALPGDFDQTSLLAYSNSISTFTAASDQSWLTLSPTSGFLGIGITSGAIILLNADAANLPVGTYHAHVSVTASAGTATVAVTFNVGSPGTLTLNPTQMSFQYLSGKNTYPSGQSAALTVSGAAAGGEFTATSLSDWLLVNGRTSGTGPMNSSVTISVDATIIGNPPAPDTYTGFVYLYASGMSAILPVTLTITGTPAGGTGSLTFDIPSSGATAAAQYVPISGNGPYQVVVSLSNSSTNWLSVSPMSGVLSGSTSLMVTVNTAGLLAGTYYGTIRVWNGTVVLQTTAVTMYIASPDTAAHLAVAPLNLTFALAPGIVQSQSVIVTGGGGAYKAQTFGKGMSVNLANGTTPAVLSVSVDPSAYSVGDVTVGYVVIQSNLGSQLITVTIKSPPGMLIQANPAGIGLIYDKGAAPLTNLQVTGVNEPQAAPQHLTVSGPGFVTLSSNSGTTPGSFGVAINTDKLGYGFNTGNITITAPGAADSPLKVPVTVLATGPTASTLAFTPPVLSLTAESGGATITKTVSLSGFNGAGFTAVAASTGAWLAVSPPVGTSPSTLTVTAKPAALAPGSYQGTVTVTTDSGFSVLLSVSLTVNSPTLPPLLLSFSSDQLTFGYRQGDPAPAPQGLQVRASGMAVAISAVVSNAWISATPISGTTPADLRIAVDPSNLAPGVYTGTVNIVCPEAANGPLALPITLNVAMRPALSISTDAVKFLWYGGSNPPAAVNVDVLSTAADIPFTASTSNAPWLAVTPVTGTTPARLVLTANPAGMTPGTYTGKLTVDAGISAQTIALQLTVMPPLPTISGIYNAASALRGAIAPGEMITIEGLALGPATLTQMVVTGDVVTTSLAGTRVLVGGFAAPVLNASATQVLAVVPYEIAGMTSTYLQVEYQQQRSNAVNVDVAATAPGVFKESLFNADGSRNSSDNPAEAGQTIVVYATGAGQSVPAGVDGRIAQDANTLPRPVAPVAAKINGVSAEVVYAGAVQGAVAGMLQVNIRIPAGATSGDLILTIGNSSSQSGVVVSIR